MKSEKIIRRISTQRPIYPYHHTDYPIAGPEMHGLVWGGLLACLVGAMAYRQKDALYRTFPIDIKRYENSIGAEMVIPCPVCPGDECEKVNGEYVKVCRFGTHTNYGCNARLDCYRGPGEICSDDRSWQCERTLSCRDNQCRGFSIYGSYEHPNYAAKDH